MMRTKLFMIILSVASVVSIEAQTKYSVRLTESEIKRNPESWMLDFSPKPKWNYCHGLELQAIYQTWQQTFDQRYYDYVYSFADLMVEPDGQVKTYNRSNIISIVLIRVSSYSRCTL